MLGNKVRLKVLAVFQDRGVTIHDYLFNYLWKNHGIRLDCQAIESISADNVAKNDLVLNAICNDLFHNEKMKQLGKWCEQSDKRLINTSQGLKNCGRQNAWKIWSKNGVATGRVEKIPRREVLLKQDINYPIIVRSEYSHLGATMKLVQNRDAVKDLEDKVFRKHTIAIEFFDYKSPDGMYHKYRCVLLGDKAVPRHVISSPEWNIHSDSRQEERMAEHMKEEYAFWERPLEEADELLRAKSLLGLDYAIADYTLMPDGKPFYFEMNPCFSVIDPRAFKREWAYQLDAVHRYCEAFADFLFEGRECTPPNYITLPMVL